MLPWQRAPDNATSKYRNNSTLAKNDFGRLFLSRAQLLIATYHRFSRILVTIEFHVI